MMQTAQSRGLRLPLVAILAALVALFLPAAASAVDSIYWANRAANTIRFADLDPATPGAPQNLTVGDPCGVAINPAADSIYWANYAYGASAGTIQVDDLNPDTDPAPQNLATGQSGPCGVAIDPAADNGAGRIYWADFNGGAIRFADLNPGGDPPQTLVGGSLGPTISPLGVAIDPAFVDPVTGAAGRIYWANFYQGTIQFDDLDPTTPPLPRNLAVGEPTTGPHGVAVDPAADNGAGRIYWANYSAGTIRFADLDPLTDPLSLEPPKTLATGQNGPTGVAVDPGANRIYWANFNAPGEVRFDDLDPTTPDAPQNLATGEDLATGAGSSNYPALLRAPAGTGAPVITGGDQVGEELSCSRGDWAPDLLGAFLFRAPHRFDYQWQKDGSDVADATEATFTPKEPGSYTCRVTAENRAGSTPQTSAPTTVRPGAPETLTLAPETATNTAGQQHCVTATDKDGFGNPTPGITDRFSVSGANSASGSMTTDSIGQAQFCYTGTHAGYDTISAYADTNNNTTQNSGEPGDTATNTYKAPPQGKISARGTVLTVQGPRIGFSAANNCNRTLSTQPSLVGTTAGGRIWTKSSVTVSACTDQPPASGLGFDTQTGTATGRFGPAAPGGRNGQPGTLQWTYYDNSPDKVQFTLRDSSNNVVYQVNQQTPGVYSGSPGGVWTFGP